MPEIIAIDFGTKRTGIAATDPLQLVASGLTTLPTREVVPFLENYLKTHEVATCVLGQSKRHDGSLSEVEDEIDKVLDYDLRDSVKYSEIEYILQQYMYSLDDEDRKEISLLKIDRTSNFWVFSIIILLL